MTAQERPVVVGVDGSADSTEAVRRGAREARRRNAPLELLLAFPWPAAETTPVPEGAGGQPVPEGAGGRTALHTMAELTLESAVQVAEQEGVGRIRSRLIEGNAPRVLSEASRAAQLLCVGTESRNAPLDALLGSTAAAVVRLTHCPVLVVPHRTGTAVEHRHGVVVGLQGGLDDQELLEHAFPAAAARETELLAVHAWQQRAPGPTHPAVDPLVPEEAAMRREAEVLEDALDGWPDRYPGVPVRRIVRHARAAAMLASAGLTAQLLVIGHRHRRLQDVVCGDVPGVDGLHSVAHALLHHATCPVLIVPLPRTPRSAADAPLAAAGPTGS